MGTLSLPLAEAVGKDVMVVEYGIGYNGTFAKGTGSTSPTPTCTRFGVPRAASTRTASFYDAVIPNYLNPDDYPLQADAEGRLLPLSRPAD